MAADRGSVPTGPSEQFMRLLRGEITAKDYARIVERRVREPGYVESRPARKDGSQRKSA
jgi:hypothetical protein